MQKTIEKIHRKFDTAGEKVLAEAKAILNAPMVNDTAKIERFQKIGFTSGKPIKDAEEMFKKQHEAKEMVEAIEYYQMYYPSYKFIPDTQIEKICKKYGLLYGDSNTYLGDIPESNLSEIENFKLREEDFYEENWFSEALNTFTIRISPQSYLDNIMPYAQSMIGIDPYSKGPSESKGIISQIRESGNVISYPRKEEKIKPPFKICAPKKDFNTQGYEVKEGFKLVYDPIVIQPVKYKYIKGGLIVSKWGIEGQDESLVNEKNN